MTGTKVHDSKGPGSPSGDRPRPSTVSLGVERSPSPVGSKLSILKYKMSDCVVICEDQGVLDTYLEKALAEERTVFILFYAMWCIPCHALVPEYDKFAASEQARGERSRLGFVAVDTSVNDHSSNEYDCEIFPALVTLRPVNGEMVVEHLEEAPTVDQMKDFLKHWAKISTEEYEGALSKLGNSSHAGRSLKGRNRSVASVNSAVSEEAASCRVDKALSTAPCSSAGDVENEDGVPVPGTTDEHAREPSGHPSRSASRAPSHAPSRSESPTVSLHESRPPLPQKSAATSASRVDSATLPSRRHSRLPSVAPASRRPSFIPPPPAGDSITIGLEAASPENSHGIREIN